MAAAAPRRQRGASCDRVVPKPEVVHVPAGAPRAGLPGEPRPRHGRSGRALVRQRERRRSRSGRARDQAERGRVRHPAARGHRPRGPRRRACRRGRPAAVLRYADPSRPVPPLRGDRRRRPHPLVVRGGVGAGGIADPVPRDDPCGSLRGGRAGHPGPHRSRDRRRVRTGDGRGDRRDDYRAGPRSAAHAGRARRVARPVHLGHRRGRRGRERDRPRDRRRDGASDAGHRH